MPIEKLENNWRDLAPQENKINTLYYDNINFMIINKLNELIDAYNIREQDRSEKMGLYIERIMILETQMSRCIGYINEQEESFNGFKESTIHKINCLMNNIKKLENKITEIDNNLFGDENGIKRPKEQVIRGCPFCGSPPEMHDTLASWHIRCVNNRCEFVIENSDKFRTKQEAIAAWNKRAC